VYALGIVQLALAIFMLGNQHLFVEAKQLEAMPYLEEAVALSEDPKGSKSRDMAFVMYMINARTMLANCYYKLGRYDDAAAMATTAVQACKVRPTAVFNAQNSKELPTASTQIARKMHI
jgi:tetratricopeptide (TPR) repeat protein